MVHQSPSQPQSNEPIRLEGLVVQNRRSRYLVIDFNAGSISVYKSPPPGSGVPATQGRSRSLPSRLVSSAKPNFSRSRSKSEGVNEADNLAHLSRELRDNESGIWEPTFTVPSSIGWKIRCVWLGMLAAFIPICIVGYKFVLNPLMPRNIENDETAFYLVFPPEFKRIDSKAEVLTCVREGRRMSYAHSSILSSVNEDDAIMGGSGLDTLSGRNTRVASDDNDSNSVSTTVSERRGFSLLRKTKRFPTGEQEVVYMFRVLLDGNEKYIWLQAAAELGRLSPESAFSRNVPSVEAVRKKIGFGRSDFTERALRYAEWAQLVGKKHTVSNFHFDVHDTTSKIAPQRYDPRSSVAYDSTHLLNIKPTYAYRNRTMTERDLFREMMIASDKWEDFRTQTVGDRDEDMIGSLHVEVLACHGLPKLDRFSTTDAVCYFVCGPFAFASDVINGHLNPIWPRKSRRACIFPLYHAYQKLYVGVFDDDGARDHDDFAGRVVVDMARMRPNSVYDVFFPLRLYQNAYVRIARGAIHLRLRIEWNNEKTALLSYLKLPKKTEQLGNSVTVSCSDQKAFRNVVLTVHGKDIPGRYNTMVQRALQREMKLYKMAIQTTMKELILDIVNYAHPLMSLCVFFAWMRVVYSNSMSCVPVYFVIGIIIVLLKNYIKYGAGEDSGFPHFGFTPIKVSELVKVLLFGGPGTCYIKPLIASPTSLPVAGSKFKSSFDELDGNENSMLQLSATGVGIIRMDGDHMEFPFSQSGRYPKRTQLESMVGGKAAAIFCGHDDDYGEEEEEEEEDQSIQVVTSTSRSLDEIEQDVKGEMMINNRLPQCQLPTFNVSPDKIWKRVKDPPGLPEQDAMVTVKATRTLQEDIIHNKNKLQEKTKRLFDDRMFIVNKHDLGHSTGREVVLNQAIGTNKYKSPITSKIARYFAPSLEILKVGLSVWRVIFNLFMWRDPYLTFLFLIGAVVLLCVLLVFPWRLFFFALGMGAVGPQNWLIRVYRVKKAKGEDSSDSSPPQDSDNRTTKIRSPFRTMKKEKGVGVASNEIGSHFRFHNHLTTKNGIDAREEIAQKSASVYRAVVPNSPLLSRRFYDWPPIPSFSKVDVYSPTN